MPSPSHNVPDDSPAPGLWDALGRPLRDLRISVTDRCNFRCRYCMPREHFGPGFAFLARSELLRFEEIARLSALFAALGVKKLRLTGGEPLLRSSLPTLVRLLADIPGVEVALTTNGALLAAQVRALADAGLSRLTVSLDSLDDAVFRRMNDTEYGVSNVLEGIEAASAAGFRSIKVNCVVRRGVNDGEVVPLARRFKGTGHVVRFIEYMDVGSTNGWASADVVSGREIIDVIGAAYPVEPLQASYPGEVAKRWRYRDGSGEVGVITSVTQPFCGACSRARLSADGNLYTCLFATQGTDVRTPLRSGADDGALSELIRGVWSRRSDRYSELRAAQPIRLRRIEMSYIGG